MGDNEEQILEARKLKKQQLTDVINTNILEADKFAACIDSWLKQVHATVDQSMPKRALFEKMHEEADEKVKRSERVETAVSKYIYVEPTRSFYLMGDEKKFETAKGSVRT